MSLPWLSQENLASNLQKMANVTYFKLEIPVLRFQYKYLLYISTCTIYIKKGTLFSLQHEVDKFLSISTCTATGHLLY